MILFADETVPEPAIAALEALDYRAVHARAVLHAGAPRSILFRLARGSGGTFLAVLPPGPRLADFASAARDAGVSAFVVLGRVSTPAALTTLLIRAWRAMEVAERELHPPFVCAVDGRGRVRRLRTASDGMLRAG